MELVLLGFMVGAWMATLVGVAYALWRYVYGPWKVVRADIAALNERVTILTNDLGARKILGLDDSERARLEARAFARKALAGE
jgi:hypothetical protein